MRAICIYIYIPPCCQFTPPLFDHRRDHRRKRAPVYSFHPVFHPVFRDGDPFSLGLFLDFFFFFLSLEEIFSFVHSVLAKRKRIFYEPFFIHMGRYRVIGMKNEKSL